jgi:hypothetical protein
VTSSTYPRPRIHETGQNYPSSPSISVQKPGNPGTNNFVMTNDFLAKSDGRYSTSKLIISGPKKDRNIFFAAFEAYFKG